MGPVEAFPDPSDNTLCVLPYQLSVHSRQVRFTAKLNSQLGLVQEQRATVVAFLFHEEDQARYTACRPGELFKPRFRPAGIWLDVWEFKESPIWKEAMPFLADELQTRRPATSP